MSNNVNHHAIVLCLLTLKLGMVLQVIISCDDLICQMFLGPFDLNLNSKQKGSREVFDELIHLELCSPKSQTWHSLFLSIAKGFKILTSFFPSPKMWVVV